ncbi:MAG: 30S ribosomal protein S12 methylthiotransferase RimO [Bacteroidales bacterium]|nr:30S ribosomal protein S12 methylthiotransferase RimO [Bacteroidales bacterium]
MKKASVITLGCSKNLVDSEKILYHLKQNDYEIEHNGSFENKDLVLVNTCGFIQDAKQESIDLILDLIEAKKEGYVKDIRVFGCLSERYKKELEAEIPEIEHFYGTYEIDKILSDLNIKPCQTEKEKRWLTTPSHYAYVKISDGCNRTCSFCAIPIIKGKHRSRPFESIIAECKYLAYKGTKEIILIAQDLSFYGVDLYKEQKLAELLKGISEIEGVEWIRMHYLYPANFPYAILEEIKNNTKVCKYIDLALQHMSDNQLKLMRRNITFEKTKKLLEKIRASAPEIAIRTTMLVGHPGETDDDFETLFQFVKEFKFDRLGGFTYSDEDNTYAQKHYEDDVDESTKTEKFNRLMELQQSVSQQLNIAKIGKFYKTIIDREDDDYYVGRTEFDSPEVDNEVLINKDKILTIGSFYEVKITSADDFDLFGEVL